MFDAYAAKTTLAEFQTLIGITTDETAHVRPTPDAWTLTEIIGHLVDSASNNHQRFARLRFGDLDAFPAYEAEPWVAEQHYDDMDFATLAALWTTYNELLFHLAETTPDTSLGNVWRIDGKELSLGFLLADYYDHMRTHVDHYRKRLAEVTTV